MPRTDKRETGDEVELKPLTIGEGEGGADSSDEHDLESGRGPRAPVASSSEPPAMPLSQQLLFIAFSIGSSVFLVTCNKYLITTMKWNFPTVLTALHMLATLSYAHGVKIVKGGGDDENELPQFIRAMYGLSLALSVVSMNLSLTYNTVTVYQLAKLLIAPAIVGIQIGLFQKYPSKQIAISLVVITVGIFWVTTCCKTGNAREQTVFGYAMALCAIATTSVNQVWTGRLQNDPTTKVSALELMRQCLPYAFLSVLFLTPFIDNVNPRSTSGLFAYPVSLPWIVAVLLSCTGAFCVNLATTLVIGKFSPITYQVIGHSKTCLLLLSGAILFGDRTISAKSSPGLLIAITGLGVYTREKIRPSQ